MKRHSAMALLLMALSGGAAASQESSISVVSFNIRYGTANDGDDSWRSRRGILFRTIRSMDADIMGLQEALAFQLEELDSVLPDFSRFGVGRDDGVESGEFAAIMFRTDRFELVSTGTFWFSDTPEVPGSAHWGNNVTRLCSWVRLRDITTERTLYFFNVHWDHESQESRERSARLLIDRINSRMAPNDPVIVTGDFNAGESNPAFRYLISQSLNDTFRVVQPGADSVGTFNGFVGTTTGQKIDAILVSEGWEIVNAAIVRHNEDGRYPSDHFPVTAVIRPRSR